MFCVSYLCILRSKNTNAEQKTMMTWAQNRQLMNSTLILMNLTHLQVSCKRWLDMQLSIMLGKELQHLMFSHCKTLGY